MKMNFEQLVELINNKRDAILSTINFTGGVPLCGRWGKTEQEKIICQVIYEHCISHEQMLVNGLVIGVSPSSNVGSGLRATDTRELRLLVIRLREATMGSFVSDIQRLWESSKMSQGVHVDKSATAAQRFANQTFRGFD